MKNAFLFLFSICIYALMGCGAGETSPTSIDHSTKEETIEEAPFPKEKSSTKPSLDNFEKIAGVDYRGKIIDKYHWEDGLGNNYIIATEYKSAKDKELDLESDEWVNNPIIPDYSEMCIKSYIFNTGKLQQIYNFCDSTTLPMATIEYINQSIETTDLDKDGQVEIYYMYSVIPDGIDPAQVYLVVSYKSDKTVIRGILPIGEENSSLAFDKIYDDKFDTLPIEVQTHAQKKWDKTMRQALEQYQ